MTRARRILIAAAALALIGSACNRDGSGGGSTISHDFQPGTELVYDTVVEVSGTMSVEESSGLSIDIPVEATISFTDTYTIAAGDEAGTFRITQVSSGLAVDGDFGFLGNTDELFPPDLSELGPPTTFVVDETGTILEAELEGLPIELADLASLGEAPFLGVSLPPTSARRGARWTGSTEVEFGGLTIRTEVESRVTDRDTSAGGDVVVIATTTTVAPIRADLLEVLGTLFESPEFRELAEIPEDEVDEMLLGFRVLDAAGATFRLDTEQTVAEQTATFDAVTGRVTGTTSTASGAAVVELTGLADLGVGATEGITGDFTIGLTFQLNSATELVSD